MSWGKKIAILYIGFVVMILFLVIKTLNEKTDLVTEDYYKDELNYQEKINREQAAVTASFQPEINSSPGNVEIVLPDSLIIKKATGSITFYRPSDSSGDFTVALQPDANGRQQIKSDKLQKGIYTIEINMSCEGKNYYFENSIYAK
jgi:hypothetical protein